MKNLILAIDQGTTGTTLNVINDKGQSVVSASHDFPQIFPQPGWVEHNLEDIWQSFLKCLKDILASDKVDAKNIAAIGITNQRETVALWDRETGAALGNAIVWQCRRTSAFCETLKKKKLAQKIQKKTGLVIDPYFSASKIRWLLDNTPGARKKATQGKVACGTMDSFLIWRLTQGKSHATDVSNASRTQLMNIHTGAWDKDLLKIFQVPENILPEIRCSNDFFGEVSLSKFGLQGIPIYGVAGDQQSALFGQLCFSVGEAKCTYGTGSFILLNTGSKAPISKSGCLTTVAWKLKGDRTMTYALEGSAFVCGAAVQWLRDGLGLISSSHEVESLARQVEDSGGVEFVPALTGMGAPYWDAEARGIICGLTRGSTKAHIARATLDAMALQNTDLLMAMEKDLKKKLKLLRVDGGASENNLLMQIQADTLGVIIRRPKMVETTSAGAAYLAGLGCGLWKSKEDLLKAVEVEREFLPKIKAVEKRKRLARWHRAIKKARTV